MGKYLKKKEMSQEAFYKAVKDFQLKEDAGITKKKSSWGAMRYGKKK